MTLEITGTPCPRCGDPVPTCGRGRPPIWCSDACKVAASRERSAARRGVIAVEVHEVHRTREPTWDELIARVLASPQATERVLRGALEASQTHWTEPQRNRTRQTLREICHE
ncbi:hypothetical protein [Austwickia chelonae]|uniref:hypothetical protein n=1 Tax=Austwickia chelonae TaxID=100225 RepID=UPI000E2801F1|nr:hypothetical protein [Austwickia chelonae]